MPATGITLQNMVPAGIIVTFAAANADGNYFTNNGRTFMRIKNSSGSSINATFTAPGICDQGFTHTEVVSIGAGVEKDIGPFPVARFNDSIGMVNVTYSAVTGVTVAAIKLS